jgi:hypothetical protein
VIALSITVSALRECIPLPKAEGDHMGIVVPKGRHRVESLASTTLLSTALCCMQIHIDCLARHKILHQIQH